MYKNFYISDLFINSFKKTPFVPKIIEKSYINEKSLIFPLQIEIELSSICNASCQRCPHKYLTSREGIMDQVLFNKLLEEFKKNRPHLLKISGLGEPFSDPLISKRLRALRKNLPSTFIKVFSNGSLIDRDEGKSLVESRINELIVTINEFHSLKYSSSTGLELETILENLENLKFIRDSSKSNIPRIFINQTIFNPDRKMKIDVDLLDYCDKVLHFRFDNWAGRIDNPFGPKNLNSVPNHPYPCFYLWNNLNIHSNGIVPLCCQDYDEDYVIADINENSITNVWKNSKLNKYRRLHQNGKRKKVSICCNCNYSLRGFDIKNRLLKKFDF